ncbi:MAG TPA: hypothetical protein VL382_02360 [Terriglobales bacterium]|nr:hypothetical protein [Terriglobales bacterium]
MDSSMFRRALRLGPVCLLLLLAGLAAAQELPPMAVQPNILPGKHKLFVTLGNKTAMGMDTVKVTVVSRSGETAFGALPTLNPYQWQTLAGDVPSDEGVVIVEYVLNDKPQKVSAAFGVVAATNSGAPLYGSHELPPAAWLAGAALLGAVVTLAGAALGRRGAAH